MTDQSYLLDGKDKKPKAAVRWFGRLMKLTFFISAFGLIIITVLYNMGGSNDMLKEGVTNTLSDIFGGRHVKLRRLNHMGFFPKVALDIEGVSVYNKSEDKVSVIDLRKFEAHMPFWNVATRSPKITSLYIEGLQTIKGVFFPEEFFIEKVFIDHDMDSGVANLKGKGTIGVHSWDFEIGLTASGRTGNYAYALADNSDVVFNVGDVHFEAVIRKDGSNYMKVSDINLVYSDRKIQGELVLSSLPGNLLKIKGELLANGGSTVLVPDVVMTMVGRKFSDFSGEISATKFVMDDLSGEKSVFEILNRFNELLGYERIPDQADDRLALFGGNNFNVDITLENAEIGDIKKDKIVFNVSQTNGNIRVGNVVADGEEIMPPVMLLYDYSKKILISIFQNGHFDSKVMGLWLQNIPQAVQKKGYLDIECGLGSFHRKDDGLSVDHFAINTQGGNQIGLKDSVIKSDISKLQFIEKQGKADLLKFELPGDLYNLVMGSFEKTKDGSPCSQYFSKAPEVTDGPSVDTDTVRREIR